MDRPLPGLTVPGVLDARLTASADAPETGRDALGRPVAGIGEVAALVDQGGVIAPGRQAADHHPSPDRRRQILSRLPGFREDGHS